MRFLFCWMALALLPWGALAQEADPYAWDRPSPGEQRDAEAMIIPWGQGSIFAPAMTNPEYEPLYSVYAGDSLLAVQTMGRSILARPGRYKVCLGSGAMDQRIEQTVEVHRGHATMVTPAWGGLVVSILDETRNSVKESYEIFRMSDAKSFGVGTSYEEEMGEHPITWILPPGLYKIVGLGESFNTYVNFATVDLRPGGLTRFTIVQNTVTGDFVGAGVVELGGAVRKIEDWQAYTAFHGSFIMNRSQQTTEDDPQTDLTFSSQMEARLRYERERHSVLSRTLIDEGFSKQEGLDFRTVLDRVSLKNVYVFDVIPHIGLYGRFIVESRLFRAHHYFEEGDTTSYVKIDEDGQLIKRSRGESVELSPNFFPLSLQEGVGVNLILLRSLRASLYVLSGYGFRQTYTFDVFKEIKDDTTYAVPVFQEVPSTTLRGFESWIMGELRISRNLLINAELDMLFPSRGQGDPVYELEAIFSLRLTKEISLHYTMRWRDANSPYVQRESIMQLRYTYLLF
ncbi:MAG: hypothetical protein KAW17_02245 [Candidatus Eisenbacteria sp.]|nr:hypothetical protein [Candidatus Eisenbacteria bacterium]